MLFSIFISCNSQEADEYEILNLVIDKCVLKATDPEELAKIEDQKKISLVEALDVLDNRSQNQQYTFSMSDTLLAENLPADVWNYLHSYDIFENKKYNESILIDFNKIKPLNNRNRVNKPQLNDHYLGHFRFYRVLFDNTRETAYMRIDIPESKGRVFGSWGLTLRKENGKWRLKN
ncbi:hypothetical protein [Chryseobacterium hagamense]|uniref:Uncharacterized protein n=1 Tax=Chryseobacterium hagamense TaxID=395935 RepID=A0A511YLH9_9FLAO|nr:hypothetical protein [Chryseobacterium hagamense]GEN76057.1 hypothetical protein CHA01nite_17970 [Chryseobacterium hagamense]